MRIRSSLRSFFPIFAALSLACLCYFAASPKAWAVPSFARKYGTSCLTCHTNYPALNAFGEAFRRNGYRFPSQNGSVDSDAEKAESIALGQAEYKKTFPDSVWPDKITKDVPLSAMMNGSVMLNLPSSDAQAAAGNTFTWAGLSGEFHLFAAGSFDDNLTYFSQLTVPDDGTIEIETGYVMWNDVVGPKHLVNVWLGRLMSPQVNSFGLHSSYMSDAFLPAVSVAGLYNPEAEATLGQGHSDGIEVNGILSHRADWSVGWLASRVGPNLGAPDAEDVYAHIGLKSGGVALDGEGLYGPNAPDPAKPWAERSITLDAFVYHGLSVFDNGTGAVPGGPSPQRDGFNAVGGSLRAQWDSLSLSSGLQLEHHARPYAGTAPTIDGAGNMVAGVQDNTSGTAVIQYNELAYTVFPWLIPALRSEWTHLTVESASAATLLRLVPGVATLVRPNIRVVVTADFERARDLPPAGSWSPAGGLITPPPSASKFQAEQVMASLAVAY